MKRILLNVLKFVLGILIIYFLFKTKRIDLSFLYKWTYIEIFIVGISSFSLIIISYLLLSFRWKKLLSLKNVNISLLDSFTIQSIGQLFIIFIPGFIGLDVIKITYITRKNPNISKEKRKDLFKTSSIITLIDRIIGLYALISLGFICFLIYELNYYVFNVTIITPPSFILYFIPFTFTICTISIIFGFSNISLTLSKKIQSHFDIFRYITKLNNHIHELKLYPSTLFLLLVISIINHTVVILLISITSFFIGIHISFLNHLLLDSFGLIINMLPFTPGGIGLTETAFGYLYSLQNINGGSNIMFSFRMIYYFNILLFGFLSLLTSFRR
jgi:glycosyltransferase 2 family protein